MKTRSVLALVVALGSGGCLASHEVESLDDTDSALERDEADENADGADEDEDADEADEDEDADEADEDEDADEADEDEDTDEADEGEDADDVDGDDDSDEDVDTDDGDDEDEDAADGDDRPASSAPERPERPTAQAPGADDGLSIDEESQDDGSTVAVPDGDALTYYRDVKPIIDEKCAICHMPGGVAPMPFTSLEEVTPYAGLMAVDIESEKMPPWLATGPLDKYVGDRRLNPTQKSTLLAWLRSDLAAGDPADEPPPVELEANRRLPTVDLQLPLPEAYTPQIDPDDYRCFVLDWPYEETKYVTALDIVPDNRRIVHHAIVYHLQPNQVQASRDRDAAEEGPGYSCMTGIGNAAWLTSYEPGGHATEVPGGLGFEILPGSAMLLQVHYNTLNGKAPDRSHVEMIVKDQVDRVGRVQLIMNPLWALPGIMLIPAGQPDVMHQYAGSGLSRRTEEAYDIYWADMHMHTLGSSGRIGINRASGEFESLLEIPKWDFAWQETFLFKQSVRLNPGDSLYVECHFDNTPEHQLVVDGQRLPPRDVSWGEGTTDEMCLGNVLMAPVAVPADAPVAVPADVSVAVPADVPATP